MGSHAARTMNVALSIFEVAFGKERTRLDAETRRRRRPKYNYRTGQWDEPGESKHDLFVESAARTLSAVQTVCDALIPPSAGRFSVVFGSQTAMTEFGRHRITVTAEPLRMKGLRLADVADTLTGFVVHEIGHVEISRDTDAEVKAWLEREPQYNRWHGTIQRIANLLDDHALEVWAKRRFPGVAHTFRVTTKFVAQSENLPSTAPRRWNPDAGYAERFNFAVVSVRYRWFVRWVADAATRRERQWWTDWADEYGDPTSAAKRLEGIKAALAKIAIKPDEEPEPETQPGESEQVEVEESEEAEPESFDMGEDDDESEDDDDDDDDTTRGGNDDDDDDWDDDEDGEDGDESDDEPEDDEGEGKGDDAEGEDEDEDGEQDGEGDEPSHQPLGESEDGTAEPSDEPWDTEDEDEGDEPGDESEGTDESGESEQWGDDSDAEGDDSDDESDLDGDDERPEGGNLAEDTLGEEGEGSSNAPIYESFEEENLRDTVKTVDDFNEDKQRYDYRDQQLMNEVQVEMKAQKVTDTHGFGSLKVIVNL